MIANTRIVRGRDIDRDDLTQIIALNEIVYGAEVAVPLEMVERVFERNRDTCLVVKDDARAKVVGYMSTLPLSPEAFGDILDGNSEELFSEKDVVEYDYSASTMKLYHLYLASVVVEPGWRKFGIFQALYANLLDLLLALGKEHKVYFEDVAARALPQGEKICRALGMSPIGTSQRGEVIFYAKMPPPLLRHSSENGRELVEFYEDLNKMRGGTPA